mmetsp:Transcript_47728/g.123770  ORF Transcript_47728/g.123770 Transcript_47728/m.123770 type:complete len:308 (-) Transcript_47728:1380-2303(-)
MSPSRSDGQPFSFSVEGSLDWSLAWLPPRLPSPFGFPFPPPPPALPPTFPCPCPSTSAPSSRRLPAGEIEPALYIFLPFLPRIRSISFSLRYDSSSPTVLFDITSSRTSVRRSCCFAVGFLCTTVGGGTGDGTGREAWTGREWATSDDSSSSFNLFALNGLTLPPIFASTSSLSCIFLVAVLLPTSAFVLPPPPFFKKFTQLRAILACPFFFADWGEGGTEDPYEVETRESSLANPPPSPCMCDGGDVDMTLPAFSSFCCALLCFFSSFCLLFSSFFSSFSLAFMPFADVAASLVSTLPLRSGEGLR